MTKTTLDPRYDSRKSFYNKAKVIETDDGELWLQSYSTIVLKIINGSPVRTWGGYSATTMRHVNEFLKQNGIDEGGKKWWDEMPVWEG